MYAIQAGSLHTPDQVIPNAFVYIDNEKIVDITSESIDTKNQDQIIDARNHIVTPGFIDLQINGAFGYDFTADPKSIWQVAARLPQFGVTSFLPTIITSPLETILNAQKMLLKGPSADFAGSQPIGLHIEGPFLNPERKGAHNPNYLLPPNKEIYSNFSPSEAVLLTTLAPELPGALEIVDLLTKNGVIVSAGHSMATYDQATLAIDHGVRYGTHIFNAMAPLHQHEPGLVGALLTDQRVKIGLIADGIHVHPKVIQIIWNTVGQERLTLVTDAMAALGMSAGKYFINDLDVWVDENSARLESGVLAGSILSLDTALRNLIRFTNCSFQAGLHTITHNPAQLLGLHNQLGKIAPGYFADLTILTQDYQVALTICRGKITYRSPEFLSHRA
jgi:N-acetylglucosamine-6-phosphate deacetylase